MVFIERGIKIKVVRAHIYARMPVPGRVFYCNDNTPIILYIRDFAVKKAVVMNKWAYRCQHVVFFPESYTCVIWVYDYPTAYIYIRHLHLITSP